MRNEKGSNILERQLRDFRQSARLILLRLPQWMWAIVPTFVMLSTWHRPGTVLASGDITPPLKVNSYFSRLLSGPGSIERGSFFKYWDFPSQWAFGVGIEPKFVSFVQQITLLAQWLTIAYLVFEISFSLIGGKNDLISRLSSGLTTLFVIGLSWLSGTTISSPYVSALIVLCLGQYRSIQGRRSIRFEVGSGLLVGLFLGPVSANPPLLVAVICSFIPLTSITKSLIHGRIRGETYPAKVAQLTNHAWFSLSVLVGSVWWVPWFLDSVRAASGYLGFDDNSWIWERYNLFDSLTMTTSWTYTPKNVAEYWSPLVAWSTSSGRFIYGALLASAIGVVTTRVFESRANTVLIASILAVVVLSILPATPISRLLRVLPLLEGGFRESSTKFAPLQICLYTLVISTAIKILRETSHIRARASFLFTLTISTIAALLPFGNGEFIARGQFPDMRVVVSKDWIELVRFMGREGDVYPTLLLPISADYQFYKSGFYGADELAGQLGSGVVGREVRYAVSANENELLELQSDLMSARIGTLSPTIWGHKVKRIVLRFDQLDPSLDVSRLEQKIKSFKFGREIYATSNDQFKVFSFVDGAQEVDSIERQ